MSIGTDSRPTPQHGASRDRAPVSRGWRAVTLGAFGLCGVLFVVSAVNSHGNDLRPGRYTDLASLVSTESAQVTRLNAQVALMGVEVDQLTQAVNDKRVARLQAKAEALRVPAGLEAVTGPGITVTLSDAPEEVINSTTQQLGLLIVHQQDIQAVVNAMWRAGARGVAVQGQRLVTTTGIKCKGPTVQLDGVPYAQPYVITAVGDQVDLLGAIEKDRDLQIYREQAKLPDIAVGWNLESHAEITVPGYTGLTSIDYASVERS